MWCECTLLISWATRGPLTRGWKLLSIEGRQPSMCMDFDVSILSPMNTYEPQAWGTYYSMTLYDIGKKIQFTLAMGPTHAPPPASGSGSINYDLHETLSTDVQTSKHLTQDSQPPLTEAFWVLGILGCFPSLLTFDRLRSPRLLLWCASGPLC